MLKKPRDLVLFPAKVTAPTQVIKVEFFPKKGNWERAGIAQHSNLSERESSNSSDQGDIFLKKHTRWRAGIAQHYNLSKQDSSNSNETEISLKKCRRQRAEIAQLYNLSEQDRSNSNKRKVSPKKKSQGKNRTRVARHSSKHASSPTGDHEQEQLAVRRRVQRMSNVA